MSDAAPAPRTDRVASIDVLRGLVMILMALDHVRDYFSDSLQINPAEPDASYPALFVTRWVSHFCAPVFLLLAGVGAGLSATRQPKSRVAFFLVTRGLWLVLLELTLVRLSFWFSFDFKLVIGLVIWTLGWSMVLLAGLQYTPRAWLIAYGLGTVLIHNATDWVDLSCLGRLEWVWIVAHGRGMIQLQAGHELFVPYKLIPWSGVMALGYALAPVFQKPQVDRRRFFATWGLLMTAAFVVFRFSNLYGDPRGWHPYPEPARTVMSFFNCEKYPPSLCYLLMTLGPAFLALAIFDRSPGWLLQRVMVLGRVPLFFYLLHIPLIHGLAVLTSYVETGRVAPWLISGPEDAQAPDGYGFRLPVVYLVTGVVVLLLYPACAWYDRLKRTSKAKILSWL
ncbi:MAG: heparan-alpha-glucosaminide N-acetyltransferase domain-containing protein [Gemmataceae bacterium]|nr:heparan-alpha-glucosaminide N-acetyltransferase domain-containing protein [Gemmataceae bacterium]